jgi:CRP-like cAMP-binding protein
MLPDVRDLLRRATLFGGLSDDAVTGLADHMRRRTFRRGTMIFHRDQAGDALYIVASGRVRLFVPAEGGEELTVDIAGPGEVFGELALLDGRPRSASAGAVEDTVTYTLDRETFKQALAAIPGLAAGVIELLSARLRHVTEYAESLAYMDVHGRLARALLELAERYGVAGDGLEIDLDLTQTELATMVGATRERVNRALAVFRSQGLVELRGRKIVLHDPGRLKDRIY